MKSPSSEFTTLMARDGHEFNAWLAAPSGPARGAVVIAQEIFGVNRHIRTVADGFAAEGYVTIAPCLFDRIRRGIELGYSEKETQEGRGYRMQIPKEKTLLDLSASINVTRHAGRVAVIGYCWGGTLAYLAAGELPIACAVAYYGGQIKDHLAKPPRRPVMYHFGEKDPYIPPADVEKIRAADPNGVFHTYPADHGFNCEERGSYDAASARLARERTLAFLTERMAAEKMESK
jgi:carboxymethylenebutenolidase